MASEEDMVVMACHVAESIIFRKKVETVPSQVQSLRNKMLDTIINLSYI